MTNRYKIFDLLGVPPRGLFVTDIQISSWGSTLLFECVYDPFELSKPFKLMFDDCQKLEWEIYGDKEDRLADVIAIDLEASKHPRVAVIHTLVFEVAISYGKFGISKDWH